MITKIEVDGFKSLSNFKLKINPGLNILVGPNGAGKTNIVQFFEFLSLITHYDLSEAFSKAGGAGSILKKIGENEYKKDMKVKINGKIKKENKKLRNAKYEYTFLIELSENNIIYFKKQRLKLYLSPYNSDKIKRKKPSLDIQTEVSEDLKTELNINIINKRQIRMDVFSKNFKNSNLEEQFKKLMIKRRLTSYSIFRILFRFFDIREIFAIMHDLRGGQNFNISPNEVKKPEDVARSPLIHKDGSGLAATLFSMEEKEGRHKHRNFLFANRFLISRFGRGNYLNKETFNRILKNVRLANDSIKNIEVINEPFSNSLKVKITIDDGNDTNAVLPLSQMSDGTIKWITLITAIFTSEQIFSIEEPENFLHPWMQSEIVKIMRDSIRKNSFVLMTTHSETLLNSANPEEIIVVKMEKGITEANRIKNIEELKNEISKTGFGLGYYYYSDTIES